MENFQTARLENYLGQALAKDGTVEVHNLQDITSGWQSQILSFDLHVTRRGSITRQGCVARLFPGKLAARQAAEVTACARRLYDVLGSMALGADSFGMRPEAVHLMQAQIDHLKIVYDLFVERTGIRIQEIELVFE